jgi:hypothetical protein
VSTYCQVALGPVSNTLQSLIAVWALSSNAKHVQLMMAKMIGKRMIQFSLNTWKSEDTNDS